MPFEDFVQPAEPTQVLWRYMDFTKFASLILTGRLFFPQARFFEDPFEGYCGLLDDIPPGSDLARHARLFRDMPNSWNRTLVISCWHMNTFESVAMWAQYAAIGVGIAVQTTVELLDASLDVSLLSTVRSGQVNYKRLVIPPGPNGASIEVGYFFKRESFQHEREYRLVGLVKDLQRANQEGGVYIPAILNTLVQRVFISPKTPEWQAEVVHSLVKAAGCPDLEIVRSELDRDPLP